MKNFAAEIKACSATFTRSTAYEGGTEYQHALESGSADCTCGHGSHVVTSDGYIIPSIYEYDNRRDFDHPAAALGSAKSSNMGGDHRWR